MMNSFAGGQTDAQKHALSSIGVVQAIESGLRCSVSIIFRLVLGYLAGLPVTALSVNAVVSMGLGLALEFPAGVIADAFGRVYCVRIGYLCQAAASLCLLGAILVWPYYPAAMWAGIILEGVLDAFGNTLLSGAREVVYKEIATRACHGETPAETLRIERQFLSLSESYGRVFLLAVPAVLLGLTVFLNDFNKLGHLALLPISAAWIFLSVKTQKLAQEFVVSNATGIPGTFKLQTFLRDTWLAIKRLSPEAKRSSGIFISFSFVFATVHGYLVVSLLHQNLPWLRENLWYSVIAVNLAFIAGRLLRSYILPSILGALKEHRTILIGSALTLTLGLALFAFFSWASRPVFYVSLLAFPVIFDNAIGFATRPSFGILVSEVPRAVATSVLSAISVIPTFLGAVFALWLTLTGEGYPSVGQIITVLVAGSAFCVFFSRKIAA